MSVLVGADPGFFLGGGALVSCSTSTPINHIVFFSCRLPVVLENRRSSQGRVRTPCTLPLDPPLELLARVGRDHSTTVQSSTTQVGLRDDPGIKWYLDTEFYLPSESYLAIFFLLVDTVF